MEFLWCLLDDISDAEVATKRLSPDWSSSNFFLKKWNFHFGCKQEIYDFAKNFLQVIFKDLLGCILYHCMTVEE